VVQNLLNQIGLRATMKTAFIDRRYLMVYTSLTGATLVLWGIEWLWSPNFAACMVLAAVASLVLLAVNRPTLALASSFPELQRIPVVRKLIG
jgi:Flp pilus assembly protein TadB